MSRGGGSLRRDAAGLSRAGDDLPRSPALHSRDLQKLSARSKDLNNTRLPRPPKGPQKSRGRKTGSADASEEPSTGLVTANADSEAFKGVSSGAEEFGLDEQGMILPHSILGSLDDFRSFLELRGDTELLERVSRPERDPSAKGSPRGQAAGQSSSGGGSSSGQGNPQSNALQHWQAHMKQRRRQQDFLSALLRRPVESLLMNQGKAFRDVQEQREFLNQVLPLIQSEYGYRVGSEFWRLPQRYGDDLSGIAATLTRKERGVQEPVAHVGQPRTVCEETGVAGEGSRRLASCTWDRSAYLQRRYQEIEEVLQDMNHRRPDISDLELIGSSKPFTCVTLCRSPLLEAEEEQVEEDGRRREKADENLDPEALPVPALRFCGRLVTWTGNAPTQQGEPGVKATVIFEALTGERASSRLELRNVGSTAVFYSWQQLPLPRLFSDPPPPPARARHFYFNNSSGVILPGETKRVEFIFKSRSPGIRSEMWRLNTHPLLLQGASLQVLLKGVSLYRDTSGPRRLFIQASLEKAQTLKMCRSIVTDIIRGIRTPERPGSPAELYVTEEQEFLSRNPELQYISQPVEELKKLWQEVSPGPAWDLSINTLRQAVLSLPESESKGAPSREKGLAQLNALFLRLCEPQPKPHQPTALAIGQQLWRRLLDRMSGEAMKLKYLMNLPEKEMGPCEMMETAKEKNGNKGENNGKTKSAACEKAAEENKRREKKKKEEAKKRSKPIRPESVSRQTVDDQCTEIMDVYTRLLHRKVYALMEDLVDTLCGLMDQLSASDQKDTHAQTSALLHQLQHSGE